MVRLTRCFLKTSLITFFLISGIWSPLFAAKVEVMRFPTGSPILVDTSGSAPGSIAIGTPVTGGTDLQGLFISNTGTLVSIPGITYNQFNNFVEHIQLETDLRMETTAGIYSSSEGAPAMTFHANGRVQFNGFITAGNFAPSGDFTNAIQIFDSDQTTRLMDFDTTNNRVGIGTSTTPAEKLDVQGNEIVRGTVVVHPTSGDGLVEIYGNSGGGGLLIDFNQSVTSAGTISTIVDNFPIYIKATPLYIVDPASSTTIATFGGGSSSINDTSGVLSLDAQNRTLNDGTGTTFNYLNMIFYSPTNHTQSLAFDVSGNTYIYGNTNITEAKNFVLGTTTGTKIGTATNQKLAFYNSTPIVQPSGDISTALSNLGLVSSGTLAGSSITGTVPATHGGTGQSSYTQGDLLTAATTTTIGSVVDVATGSVLVSGGANTVPSYSTTPTITTSVTCPTHIGGTATNSTLSLTATSGVGASGADIIFKTGNNGATETMRTHFDGTFALFGVGKTPTAFCDITGAAPASVAGTGTTATATFNVVGARGGATSGTSGPTGGLGSSYSIASGPGGDCASASTGTGTGGASGSGTITTGVGDSPSGSSTNLKGGASGSLTLSTGNAGGPSISSGHNPTGGDAGAILISGGGGGSATSGGSDTSTGGRGANITITPGPGGTASTSSGTTVHGPAGVFLAIGGTGGGSGSASANGIVGGTATMQGGPGGATTTGTSGGGGDDIIAGGVAGANSGGTSGVGGKIQFKTAATTSLAVVGTITKDGRWAVGGTNTSPTGILEIAAGTTSIPPLTLLSGTNTSTAVNGSFEYNGTNLFFTRASTTRENVLVAVDGASAPTTAAAGSVTNRYGGATNFLGDPNRWISVNIAGTVYKIPMYT